MSLVKLRRPARARATPESGRLAAGGSGGGASRIEGEPLQKTRRRRQRGRPGANVTRSPEFAVECTATSVSAMPNGPPGPARRQSRGPGAGIFMALSAQTGSGKSTLANVIAGRLQPLAGTALINGVRVDGAPPTEARQVGHAPHLPGGRTCARTDRLAQNSSDGRPFRSRSPASSSAPQSWPLLPSARRDMAWMAEPLRRYALQMVGAGSWAERKIGDVPHGVEQLTQLGVGAASLAPTSSSLTSLRPGLSAREVDHLAEILAHLKAQGVTMIIIEHQTRFLFPLCDQVTVLNAGEVIFDGNGGRGSRRSRRPPSLSLRRT